MIIQMSVRPMLHVQASVDAIAGIQRQVSFVQVSIARHKPNIGYL